MGIPYEQANVPIIVAVNNDIMPLAVASPADIVKVIAASAVEAAFTLDIWSRDIRATAYAIQNALPGAGGKAAIRLETNSRLKPADLVTIAGTTGAVYAGDHRILTVDHALNIVTIDTAYVADTLVGTVTLKLSAWEKELYRVIPQLVGAANVAVYAGGAVFIAQDPDIHGNRSAQTIYFQFSKAGTYRVTIAQMLPEDTS